MEKNISKYLNNTTQTFNGLVFKDEDAFKNKKGICYIGEFALEVLQNADENGNDFSDEELIDACVGETYETIIEEVKRRWDEFDDEVKNECTPEEVAENVFNSADWTCISTEIDQMTY